ncbi:predicted protein, partial [Aspergillus lentulus]
FEKDALHAAVRDGLPLESTLEKLRRIWETLYERGGSFEITDVDDFRHLTCYGWKDVDGNSLQEEEEGDPRTLAGPALSAEEFKVNIPPVRCELNKRAGAPAVVRLVGATHWYRIISFQGLAAILKSKTSWLEPPFRTVPLQRFRDLLDVHVRCKGRSEDANPFEAKWAPFHITWFKISPNGQRPLYGDWKSGRALWYYQAFWTCKLLARDGLHHGHFSVQAGSCRLIQVSWYWSILHLAPAHFCPLHQETSWPEGRYDGHMIPVALILQALRDAADSWEQVANHLSSLVDDQGAIFDPDEHDRLLFDDNTFSRSRLYFWPIDRLGMFIPSISATMREWQNFWEARKHIFNAGENFIREVRRETGDAAIPWCAPLDYLANLVPQVEGPNRLLRGVKILSRKYALPD